MAIIFSTNPLDWYATEGISVNEQAPPPAAQITGGSAVSLVGEFPWGPSNQIVKIDGDNADQFQQFLGRYSAPGEYGGVRAVVGKTFGTLKIVRIEADDAVKASRILADTVPTNAYTATAKYSGVAGNEIQILHEKIDATTFNITVIWGTYSQKHEGVTLATLGDVDDDFVDFAAHVDGGAVPETDGSAVALSGGSDGTIADEEYIGGVGDIRGLRVFESDTDGGVFFIAEYTSAAVITAVVSHAADKRAIGLVQGAADTTDFAAAETAAAAETSDRVGVALHGAKQTVDGTQYNVHLTAFAASILSQLPPHYSLADDDAGAEYLSAIDDVVDGVVLSRSNFIAADDAGGIMLEARDAGGFKFHAGLAADSSLLSNRRVLDIAGLNAAQALLSYQSKPNMPEFDEPAVEAIRGRMEALQGEDGIPASKIIADSKVTLKSGAVVGSDLYELAIRLWGEKRFQVLTITAGETVTIEG